MASAQILPSSHAVPVSQRPQLVYDQPNPTYFLYIPFVFVAFGLMAWFVPTNSTFLVCTFLGTVAGIFCIFDLVILEGPLRFSRILAMTLLLGYALGAFNSWYTIPRGSLTLAEFFIQDPAALARAQGGVLFACATLFCLGEVLEKPLLPRGFKLEFDSRVITFGVLATLVTCAAYATKALAFMGAVVGETHELGVFPTLAIWVISPAFALTVAAAFDARSLATKSMLLALSAVQMACILPISRRTLLYSLLVAMIATRFVKLRFQLSMPRKLLVLAIAGGLFYAGNITFYYMRATLWHSRTTGHLSIVQLGRATVSLSQQTDAENVMSSLHQNEQTRTFILGYFSDVLNGSLNNVAGQGLDLLHQIDFATPRVFNPNKTNRRYLGEEQIAADLFGLKPTDQANSVLTGGAIDFGILGVIVYPICLALLVRLYVLVLSRFVPPWLYVVVVLNLMLAFLQPEGEFGTQLVEARNSLLFSVVLMAVAATPRFRISLKLDR